jgi:hypothetical protein
VDYRTIFSLIGRTTWFIDGTAQRISRMVWLVARTSVGLTGMAHGMG